MPDFGRETLPLGVFRYAQGDQTPRIGVAVDEGILDLADALGEQWKAVSLNGFLARGRSHWEHVRAQSQELLDRPLVDPADVVMQMPFDVADYVDFYASEAHATNVGRIFRPDGEPLLPNWKHLPVGYHGRGGTVVVSGTTIVRPCGLRAPGPAFGASAKLDIEAELGFVVGTPSRLGQPVSTSAFADHVFGIVLLNDWSARDIQAYEYQPLGPFLGKSFATSISPWVVPLAALTDARGNGPTQQPEVAKYLQRKEPWALDLEFEVYLNNTLISRPPFRDMYWTADQMLAHQTVNGASLRTGDLFGSGTISGTEPNQLGSLLEITWNGAEPITVGDAERTFLEDGDTVTISARTRGGRHLGEVTGTVAPAPSHQFGE